jgi:subtilisin family serine protease/subtilisin-like proprotein convertase family protein
MARKRMPPRRITRPLTLESLEDRTLLSSNPLTVTAAPATYATGDILVQFQTTPPGQTPTALPGTTLGPALSAIPGLYEVLLGGGTTVAAAVAEYRADPRVVSAEPDYNVAASSVPNDPQFSQQWYLNNTGQNGGTPGADIHAEQAWNVTTGNAPTVVATVDTGIDYTHPDLYQNVWLNQAEIPKSRLANLVDVDHDGFISFADLNNPINQGPGKITDINQDGRIDAADILAPMVLNSQGQDTGQGGWAYLGNTQDGDTAHPNDFVGWNFVTNTNNPFDDNDHGTEIGGIIAAKGNNGVGVAGIDWHAQIMPVKFMNMNGSGTISDAIAAIDYAVQHGAKILNNSWTGSGNSVTLEEAIAAARSQGAIFVAAAGNSGANNDTNPEYPASFPLDNIVSVGSTDNHDNLTPFSNYGPHSVALAAPGIGIYSTSSYGGYASLSGTSASTPQVTGVLALVWGQHPNWTYTQVINQVLDTADKLPGLAGKLISGGRLDAAAAVGSVATPPASLHVVSATDSGSPFNKLSAVRLTFNAAVNPATFTAADVVLTGPGGQAIGATAVNPVAGSGNTQFDLLFPTQTTPGTYTLQVGPNVLDTSGNLMQLYRATFTLNPSFTFSLAQPMAIPNNSLYNVALLPMTQDMTIGQVTVQMNITYPDTGDLYIHLQAPDGTDILLFRQRGGAYPNLQNTLFSDSAPKPIGWGFSPFAGSWRPEVPLSYLNGKSTVGTWKLWVENHGGRGSGMLNSWSLTFTPSVDTSANPAAVAAGGGSGSGSATTAGIAPDTQGASTAGAVQVPPGTASQPGSDPALTISAAGIPSDDPPTAPLLTPSAAAPAVTGGTVDDPTATWAGPPARRKTGAPGGLDDPGGDPAGA